LTLQIRQHITTCQRIQVLHHRLVRGEDALLDHIRQ
jgi:hypothetical protein